MRADTRLVKAIARLYAVSDAFGYEEVIESFGIAILLHLTRGFVRCKDDRPSLLRQSRPQELLRRHIPVTAAYPCSSAGCNGNPELFEHFKVNTAIGSFGVTAID